MAAAATSSTISYSAEYADRCISYARSKASNLEYCAYKLAEDEYFKAHWCYPSTSRDGVQKRQTS